MLAAGATAATLAAAFGRDGDDSAAATTLPRPGATAPAGTPPGGWRDATRDHGAQGTGEGDDAGSLQDAIDAAAAEGSGRLRGGIVHLGPGVYPIGVSLQMRSGVTLWGSGPATVIRLLPGVDEAAVVIERNGDDTPVAYATVRSLTLDGSTGSQSAERHGIAIRSNNSGSQTPYTGSDSFPLVADVTIAYFGGHGLGIGVEPPEGTANVRGARAFNVIAFECAKAARDGDRAGISVAGTDAVLVACDVAGSGGPGIAVTKANNRLESCKTYFNRTELLVTGERNQLIGCQAQDGFGDGFVLRDVADTTLEGCQADSNDGAGFRLETVTSSVVSGLTSFVRGELTSRGPGVTMTDVSRCLVSGVVRGFPTAVVGENVDGITHLVT